MNALLLRDYRNPVTKRFGFSTGIYQNFGERISVRYLCFQIRGIGSLQFSWEVRGFEL